VQALGNLKEVLGAAGGILADVVDITTFHTNMRDFSALYGFMEMRDRTSTRIPRLPGPLLARTCWVVPSATSSKSGLLLCWLDVDNP
jgi:enamine deaminase RidA (YjgF/YER057c/UK114 family)